MMEGNLFSDSDLDEEKIKAERDEIERQKEIEAKKKENKRVQQQKEFDKRLFILDGYSIIYKSYFAHTNKPIVDKDGKNLSAYYGFFQTIFKILREYQFDYFVVALDAHGKTFRHEMYEKYKSSRDKASEDLHAQIPDILETLKKMHILFLSHIGFEADDIIASLVKKATEEGIRSVIVTADKDLCQLVSENVTVLKPPQKGTNDYQVFGIDEVKEKYEVYPNQIVDYLTITGDSADDIPGIPGLGHVNAVKLLDTYVTLDGIYRHLDALSTRQKKSLIDGKEMAELSKKLVELRYDAIDPSFSFSDADASVIDKVPAAGDFDERGFKQLAKRAGLKKTLEEGTQTKPELPNISKLKADEKEFYLGNGTYYVLRSSSEVFSVFEKLVQDGKVEVAFDLISEEFEDDSPLVAFSFSAEMKKAYYVPLGESFCIGDFLSFCKKYLESGLIKGVFHNAKFFIKRIWALGSDVRNIEFDTMLAYWILDSNAAVFSLNSATLKFFYQNLIDRDDLTGKKTSIKEVSENLLSRFSQERADYIFRLYSLLKGKLVEKNLNSPYYSMELPLIRILARMEKDGIYLSEEKMKNVQKDVDDRLLEVQSGIYSLVGHQFNINSPMQLGTVLFSERKLPSGKHTERGFSTNSETLESLKDLDPVVPLVLEYRALNKLKNTYIDTLPLLRDGNGRIHTTFLQTGTATGRLSSRNPNLQNIPVRTEDGRLIRSTFTPTDGRVFLSADYSQIELVVLAYMSDDADLIEAFRRGEDIHQYTASLIFNKNLDKVTQKERRIAKTINFGIIYGMSAFRLARDLGISRSDATAFISKYFSRYKGVSSFIERVRKHTEETGYIVTEFGHIREVTGINSANKIERNSADRVALNSIVQGTAAEIMKKAMINIAETMENRNLKSRLLLSVHDELIFEVERSEMDEVKNLVKSLMESVVKFSVPLKVSLEWGECWGDIH